MSSSPYVTTVTIGTLTSQHGDYSFTFVNGSVAMTAAVLTVTANAQTKVYGAAVPALTFTITGFKGTDTQATAVTGAPVLSNPVTQYSSVSGSPYTTTVTIGTLAAVNGNYTFTLVNGSVAVTPAVLTVTANNPSIVYGAAIPALTFTITGFLGTDTQATAVTGAPVLSNPIVQDSPVAGSPYTTTVTLGTLAAVNGNYTFTLVNGSVTETKAILTVAGSIQGMIQGAAVPTLTYTITGFQGSDTALTATSGAPLLSNPVSSASVPGVYTTTVAIGTLTAANYTITLEDGSVTVAQNVLTVTASAQVMVAGTTPPTLAYTITGFIGSDTQASALSGQPVLSNSVSSSSPAGVYPTVITQGTLASVTVGKYAFDLVNGSVTVEAAGAAAPPSSGGGSGGGLGSGIGAVAMALMLALRMLLMRVRPR